MPRLTFKLSSKPSRQLHRKEIAQTFTAYLIGCRVFDPNNQYPMEKSSSRNEQSWHLDMTNDFWLHFDDDGSVHLDCRYDGELPLIKAMLALFKVNYRAALEPA